MIDLQTKPLKEKIKAGDGGKEPRHGSNARNFMKNLKEKQTQKITKSDNQNDWP